MKNLRLFKKGDPFPSAERLNEIVRELRRLQNIQADKQSSLEVTHTDSGVLISNRPRMLLIDDKYLLDSNINQSTRVRRECDRAEADIADFFRIRARPGGTERPEGISKTLTKFLLMQAINPIDDQGGEFGWVTDAGQGSDFVQINGIWQPAPPIRRVAQWGTIVQLTDDDVSVTTPDGDGFSLVNLRDDAHVHRSVAKDGRVFYTDTPAGDEPTGFPIVGEMVGDERKANADTRLGRETVEWRPQLKIPNLDIPGEVYTPRDGTSWSFPPLTRIPNSSILAYNFGTIGQDEGWSSHYQPHHWLESYGLGFLIKYTAENLTGATQNAYMALDWKEANDGDDISTAGMTSSDFLLPVPALSTEQDLNIAYFGFVPTTGYTDKSLIICDHFGREAGNVLDTLGSRLFIIEVKMIFMVVVVPP